MNRTKIEWTEVSWNPITGCTPISEGCQNCYAARMAKRLAGRYGYPADDPFRPTFHSDRLHEPYRWESPKMIFVCSMGDLFHEDIPAAVIYRILRVIKETPQHTYQLLTKRPERARTIFANVLWHNGWDRLPNLWLGVSIENQKRADERMPHLLTVNNVGVRFVSIEPMLAEVSITQYLYCLYIFTAVGEFKFVPLDWVIVGGETGPGARPVHPDWVRKIRDECLALGIPFFFKHWGEWKEWDPGEPEWSLRRPAFTFPDGKTVFRIGRKAAGRLLDGREWNELPMCAAKSNTISV